MFENFKQILEKLLSDLGFSATVSLTTGAEGDPVQLTVEAGPDNALLIGFHGETLNSLQNILSLIIFRQTGTYAPVVVDIGGYRQERSERLRQMAVNAADRARFLAQPIELAPLPAAERRLVHLYVSQLPGVKSESIGEGRERRVVVAPAELEKV